MSKEVERVREEIAKADYEGCAIPHWNWETASANDRKWYLRKADKILNLVVIPADDQSLPKFPLEVTGDITRDRMYIMGIRDKQYKDAGWVKCIKEGE